MQRLGALACLILATMASPGAIAADVDWKLYGGTSIPRPAMCFYDANGVVHTPDGNVRVWTKCLPRDEMEPIINLKQDSGGLQIAENAAQEIAQAYVPPIVVAGIMQFDRIRDIAIFEQIADIGPIEPGNVTGHCIAGICSATGSC
jgi:hypothetical protein